MFKFVKIADHKPQEVIKRACHEPTVHNLGKDPNVAFKMLQSVVNLFVQANRDKYGNLKAQLCFVDPRGIASDDTIRLKTSDPSCTGGWRKSDLLTELQMGQSSVLLKRT